MNQYRAAQERAIFRILVLIILVLMVLCLLAVLVLGVLKLTLNPQDPIENPDPTEENEQPDAPSDEQPGNPDEGEDDPNDPAGPDGEDQPTGGEGKSVLLPETADAGQGYIDRMVFFGESTTAHLRARGVLTGGSETKQVWANETGTMMLDLEILKKKITYPETGESLTIEQAVTRKKPDYMVLSFGVNGLINFHSNPKLYASSYAKLIGAIRTASPDTVVILQTVYPVGVNQTSFSQDAVTLNGYINELNEQLLTVAEQSGAYVVDTASSLKDADGNLSAEYATSDGLHLTAAAYEAVLHELRTHAVQ